jgi:hypothetical protein
MLYLHLYSSELFFFFRSYTNSTIGTGDTGTEDDLYSILVRRPNGGLSLHM